jgi:hypothetical protein
MLLQENSYEIRNEHLKKIQEQMRRVRQAHIGAKRKSQMKSSKRLIATYLFILSATSRY